MKVETKVAALTFVALLAVAHPRAATAGTPVDSMGELQERVHPGTRVIVTDHEGQAFVGRFILADRRGVLFSVAGERQDRRMDAVDVATVTRVGDSWARGIILGAGVAVLPSVAFVSTAPADRSSCYDDYCRPWCVSDACRLSVGISMVAVGATIGAIIDRNVVGREVVFDVSGRREPVALSVVPYAVRGGGAVRVALKF